MKPVLIVFPALAGLAALAVHGASSYPHDLARWRSVTVPPESARGDRAVWDYAAGYSKHEWRVFLKDGRPQAQLEDEPPVIPSPRPSFVSKESNVFYQKVEDGWLVDINRGEWGGSLDWFSPDGRRKTHVADLQFAGFFKRKDGLYALEGLAHLSISRGSIFRLQRSASDGRWKASEVLALPAAPYVASLRRDGTAVVTLSDRVVAFSPDRKLRTLFEPDYYPLSRREKHEYSERYVAWSGLYPNSSVLSPQEDKLYVGMRQYVGEINLATKRLRMLVPSDAFLNRLSKDDERTIRSYERG